MLSGERNPMSKLTWGKVNEIRKRFKKRIVTGEMLSNEYDVSKWTICQIIRGKSWT